MHFNAPAFLTSMGLVSWVVHATPSPASISSTACPPQYASEIQQRQNFEAFVQGFYVNKTVAQAFDKYVWVDYIQHNPDVPQGRDAAITYLEGVIPSASIQIVHQAFDNNTGYVHHYDSDYIKIVDVYRFDGSCIVEHWDVIANLNASEINPTPLATPPPVITL